jgi:hypothetical protein
MNATILKALKANLFNSVQVLEELVRSGIVSLDEYKTLKEAIKKDYELLIESEIETEKEFKVLTNSMMIFKDIHLMSTDVITKKALLKITTILTFCSCITWFVLWEMEKEQFSSLILELLASMDDFINKQPSF